MNRIKTRDIKGSWSEYMKKFNCDACGKEITSGEFMAVIAKSPTKDHVGRTDAILKKWVKTTDGVIYCEKCFENKFES